MQKIGRVSPPGVLQLECRRPSWRIERVHPAFLGQLAALEQIARLTGRDDVLPSGTAAARARHDVIEGQMMAGEVLAAILACEMVAQEDIEPGEGNFACRRHVFLERDDGGELDLDRGRADRAIVVMDDVDAAHEGGLDGILPRP